MKIATKFGGNFELKFCACAVFVTIFGASASRFLCQATCNPLYDDRGVLLNTSSDVFVFFFFLFMMGCLYSNINLNCSSSEYHSGDL